jgi:hypothetical protein
MERPVEASQAWPQSSIWQALDLNNWKEDQKALGSSLSARRLLEMVRGQEKKWPLNTTLPQGYSLMASGGVVEPHVVLQEIAMPRDLR